MSDPTSKSTAPARPRRFARVFMNGRSQAIRLPQEFRFDTDRVGIRREGCNVILTPLYEDWDDYFDNAPHPRADLVDAMASARTRLKPFEHREPFD